MQLEICIRPNGLIHIQTKWLHGRFTINDIPTTYASQQIFSSKACYIWNNYDKTQVNLTLCSKYNKESPLRLISF